MRSNPRQLGATVLPDGSTRFAVWSGAATKMWVSLFGHDGEAETDRIELPPEGEGVFAATVPGVGAGMRYGFRVDGPCAPEEGLWFDPDKLLVDPYAVAIDRPYRFDARLAGRRGQGGDTASLMPKAIATLLPEPVRAALPLFRPGGLVYELQVRSFTMRHAAIPAELRGTIGALAHPSIIEHLLNIGVSAVELMPVTAWIDERHLGPLGLTNAWGYNPITFMALDPRLAPGGLAELRATVEALRAAGIGVILDLVFNHTGESDAIGPTLSLRGLDDQAYYRHAAGEPGVLVNDTGTGNTIACDHPVVSALVLDSLRHFVSHAGVDGFRFDLAPILGRTAEGFDRSAALLTAMTEDPVLADRVLIAEPWDIGPDGYQLGQFPTPFLEWNDRYRDDVRRFWRDDRGMVPALATRLAGSFDVFAGSPATRSVNFLAAHDGFALGDLVRYGRKHNEANGEQNRDGHNENISWNNGVEGETDDPLVLRQRGVDMRALLATLFLSRGTLMLTAGDEFGRTQHGNNNAYAQDNSDFWLDWEGRDTDLENYVAALSKLRRDIPALGQTQALEGAALEDSTFPDVTWLTEAGVPLSEHDWHDPDRHRLVMVLAASQDRRVAVVVNGDRRASIFSLPERQGWQWQREFPSDGLAIEPRLLQGRTVGVFVETTT